MNNNSLKYTVDELNRFTESLDPKTLKRLVRGTFKAEAQRVRRAAMKELKISAPGVHNIGEIGKSIRAGVTRSMTGFFVSASNRAIYRTTRGRRKPLALWLNKGTCNRYAYIRVRGHKPAARGNFKGTDFIAKTEAKELPRVETNLDRAYRKAVDRQIKRILKS